MLILEPRPEHNGKRIFCSYIQVLDDKSDTPTFIQEFDDKSASSTYIQALHDKSASPTYI